MLLTKIESLNKLGKEGVEILSKGIKGLKNLSNLKLNLELNFYFILMFFSKFY